MTETPDSEQTDAERLAERNRERTAALRACRPRERLFIRQLPKSRYAPYAAGAALGLSSNTVHKMLRRPRVRAAMEFFLAEALEEIGVSHVSLVADLQEVKERCMQHRQATDKDGKSVGEYQFDSRGAIAAAKELAELIKVAPAKRIEISGPNGEQFHPPMLVLSREEVAELDKKLDEEV